jgi:hypothetical protein
MLPQPSDEAGNQEGASDEHPFVIDVTPPITSQEMDYLLNYLLHSK